ncbi:MAG: hypothetical protein K6A43_12010, partial [Treponema sp.]|nr:hypothetical protein [Treponema sp.]
GRVNLHDLSVISQNENTFNSFFNTLPMTIIEIGDESVRFTRANQSYHDFFDRYFGILLHGDEVSIKDIMKGEGSGFMLILRKAAKEDKRLFIDEKLPDGSVAHYFVSKLAENPVNHKIAVVAAILSIKDAVQGETYENIARALATDYFNLFYVNLETEEFIEYVSNVGADELATERHGIDFFKSAREEAKTHLYEEDRESFIKVFTKENVIKQIEETGTFIHIYRLMKFGFPYYVNMKAVRLTKDKKYLIIGVSNIDSQVKQREIMERARQNQIVYSRLMALSGDYLCIYVINPEDNTYTEFQPTSEFQSIGIKKHAGDFFVDSQINADVAVAEEDREVFKQRHTKETIMKNIETDGVFTSRHHILINGEPIMVQTRCVLSKENGEDRLIMGVRKV